MEDIKQVIGNNIRIYRTKLKWSQEKLAEKSGLHRTYIGAVERGEKNLTVTSLERISNALCIDIRELLHRKRQR